MTDAARKQTTPPIPTTAAERLRRALRPEFLRPFFRPSREDRALWQACAVDSCQRRRNHLGLCRVHARRLLKELGKTTPEVLPEEIQDFVLRQTADHDGGNEAAPIYDFTGLPPILADEARLTVQALVDTGGEKGSVNHFVFARTTRALKNLNVQSIFDLSRITARDVVMYSPPELDVSWYQSSSADPRAEQGFVRKMMRVTAVHHAPVPVRDRMVWYPADFGLPEPPSRVHGMVFYTYRLPWMVEWAKRWALYEIRGGRPAFSSLLLNTSGVGYLDEFLAAQPDCPPGIDGITRNHLTRFLRWLHDPERGISRATEKAVISRVRTLLRTHERLRWEPALRPDAVLRRGEVPKAPPPEPRPVDPFILDQLMSQETLGQLEPWLADALVIGRHQGLRPSSIVTLPLACLRFNGEGEDRPVLDYRNVKGARDDAQPILQRAVVDAIRRQQGRVRAQHGDTCPWLFPGLGNNPRGRKPMRPSALPAALSYGLQHHCEVRDRRGERITQLAWGQLRDTRATELVNDGLSPTLVAAWLGHTHLGTIQHYGKMHLRTLRGAIDDMPLLNIRGEDIRPRVEGASSRDVEALRHMIHEATNAVQGGLCTLPAQEDCPHLNRCYSCEKFGTTPNHLPELFSHLQASQMLAMAHEQNGSLRMAEGQRRAVTDLKGVVTTLGRWVLDHPDERTDIEGWVRENRDALVAVVNDPGD